MELWQQLKCMDGLSVLPDEALQALAAAQGERIHKKRHRLFGEGETAEAVYFLLQGKVKLIKVNLDGLEKMLTIIRPGQFFGEIAVMDGSPAPYTAETLEEVRLIAINKESFHKLLHQYPLMACELLRIEAKRLRHAYRHMKNLALLDTHGRVAASLVRLAHNDSVSEGNTISIRTNLTRQEMAQLIGTSRETVSRILAEYERLGILEIDRQTIIIRDMEELRYRASGGRERE
ncbi:Crp/Fnr family transcriptional regulator [Heliophilum fasciatum]|uniref:Crp/Fnr family transcriptional regulator n=1 Tax=Heliophilum fasciatum TaxID=35700 RepID=A0A4R2RQY7_9FIRM|nr:Crp/Fnr family transcriptional regulator [Heliophilum fasciatum]MCW2277510.1 CRP/FNR family transcriptional regulator [Heliophilum fasciatum]TCP65199.1 Crp/Fnr family transcriptional regulator [Heliophilum fasciatum]